MKIVFATNNAHKIEEVQQMIPDNIELVGLKDIGCTEDIPETQDTIEGNAIQKAEYVLTHYQMDCFSEDTGLEVMALGGAPGVHTARYAGDSRDAHANMDLLLKNLEDKSDRSAQFKTVIALHYKNKLYTFEGIAKGKIAFEKTGDKGFGYDPIFIPEGYDQSFAELSAAVKNKISHRAKAVQKLISFMQELHIKKEQEKFIREMNDSTLNNWREAEKTALELMQIVGELRFDRSIDLVLFRNNIYDASTTEVIEGHKLSLKYSDKTINLDTTLSVAHSIANIKNFQPARIDIGKLAIEWNEEKKNYADIDEFVKDKLSSLYGDDEINIIPRDIILYGFGRIGRLAARRIIAETGRGEQLRLKAIVVRQKMSSSYEEAVKRAALLKDDTVHGTFKGTIEIAPDGSELIINGNRIKLIFAGKPADIDYTNYGIQDAIVIDNTGVWRDKAALGSHLRPGVKQVILTAPAADIPNIVYGVNQKELDINENPILCAASCTTNAIVPILKVIDDKFKIVKGHIETIHAYTSDQNLLDNFHKKPRRGRGAATNMVLTSTGAAKAVSKVLPHLKGKFTGNAVRVPVPNVSLAIMNITIPEATTRSEVIDLIKHACFNGALFEQIHFSESTEYVSSNAVGMTSTSVFDAPSTAVSADGKNLTIYAWYDNEFGYTCQVVRLAKHVAGVRRGVYY